MGCSDNLENSLYISTVIVNDVDPLLNVGRWKLALSLLQS